MIANRLVPIVILVLVVLLSTIHHGEAIICYKCNSAYDPRCGDPFNPYSLGTVNCSFRPRLNHLNNLAPTLCRKITQKVYGKIRVIRDCGYITDARDDGDCLVRSGTHDVQVVYCACTGDLCNSAESHTPSFLLPLTSLLMVILAMPNFLLSYRFAIPVLTSPHFSIA